MKKRKVSGVTIETVSSNFSVIDSEYTKYSIAIPVNCTHKTRPRIDVPAIMTSLYRRQLNHGHYAKIIAYFIPDLSDILMLNVRDKLIETGNWDSLSKQIFDYCLEWFASGQELCGGTLYIHEGLAHPVDSNLYSFKMATSSLLNSLLADWLNGSDEEIKDILLDK